MEITDQSFSWFVKWLQKQAGIALRDDQRYLVKSRIEPLIRTIGWEIS